VSIATLIDFGLAIGGWVTMSNRTVNLLLPTAWTVASTVLIFCIFLYEVGLFAWFWRARSSTEFGPEDHRLLTAPALQTLPMLVRNIHPLIFVGTGSLFWNQVVGNGYVYLFMIVVPEILVVAVSIWCIRGVSPLPKDKKKQKRTGVRGTTENGNTPEAEMPLQSEDHLQTTR
jgi:hypothetical protein